MKGRSWSILAAAVILGSSCSTGMIDTPDDEAAQLAAAVYAYDAARSIDTATAEEDFGSEIVARGMQDLGGERTVVDLGNGRERITRTWTSWNGIAMKSVAERMKAPDAGDARWADGDIIDGEAIEELYAGDLERPFSTAGLTVTWRLDAEAGAYVHSVLREGERIRANGDFLRSLTVRDADGRIVSRRVEYLRVGETVAARTLVYAYEYGEGAEPLSIRVEVEGGEGYALVLSVADPRVIEWYADLDGDGQAERALRVEKTRDTATGEQVILRTRYDAAGAVAGSASVRVRIAVEDGAVKLTRVREDGSVYRVSVEETADGYLVRRGQRTYAVTVGADGSVLIESGSGSWLATPGADGSWTVTAL